MDWVLISLEFIIIVLLTVLLLIVAKFPFVIPLLFAKSAVLEINEAGVLNPQKARSVAGALITKNGNRPYRYSKRDVIRFSGIMAIMANKDTDSRALNPDIMPVLSLFKKLNVDSLEDVTAILLSPLLTKEEYRERVAAQIKAEQEAA